MKTIIFTMVFCLISYVSIGNESTIFKQGKNGIFAINPSQKKAEVITLFPYKPIPFQLRYFYKDTLSINATYYAGNRNWYNKACFLNIKNGKVSEFIPDDFNMRDYSVSYSYHIIDNIWLICLMGPELSTKTVFFDIVKKEIVDYKLELPANKLPFKNSTERNEWLQKLMSQKSIVDIMGSVNPTTYGSDFKALISGNCFLVKKNNQLVLYDTKNMQDLEFVANLSKFDWILKFDWKIETLASGNLDYPIICDFQDIDDIKNQLSTSDSISKEDVINMIVELFKQNLSGEFLLQIANDNLYEYIKQHLKIDGDSFVIKELFELVIYNELTTIGLKIEIHNKSNTLSCQTFSISILK